ncbi:hypothetical protein QYF36_024439 [Acer negundo]|nr:hypothetical protein QYF36_024439 [Acer negundo]
MTVEQSMTGSKANRRLVEMTHLTRLTASGTKNDQVMVTVREIVGEDDDLEFGKEKKIWILKKILVLMI